MLFFFCILLLLSAVNILHSTSVKCMRLDILGGPDLGHVGACILLQVDKTWMAKGCLHAACLLGWGRSTYVPSQGSLQSQRRPNTQFSLSEAEYELLIWDHFGIPKAGWRAIWGESRPCHAALPGRERSCVDARSSPTVNTNIIMVPGQACERRSVVLFIGFLSQIWKFSSSHTGTQAQSRPDTGQGGIQVHLPSISHCQDSLLQLYMWVPPLWHLTTLQYSCEHGREGWHLCFQVGNGGKDRLSDVPKVTQAISGRGGTDKSVSNPCSNSSHDLSCMRSTEMS